VILLSEFYETTYSGAQIDSAIQKVSNIEDDATRDQTAEEIKTAYESNDDTNVFTNSEKTKLALAVKSDVTGIIGADAIANAVSLTQAEYDALVSKDATTLYVIVG
jgi:hypothetical protein